MVTYPNDVMRRIRIYARRLQRFGNCIRTLDGNSRVRRKWSQGFIDGCTHRGEYVLIAEDGANDISGRDPLCEQQDLGEQSCHTIRGLQVSRCKYLSYAFKVIGYSAILVGVPGQSSMESALRAITMPLPNLPERRAMAEVLSGLMTSWRAWMS